MVCFLQMISMSKYKNILVVILIFVGIYFVVKYAFGVVFPFTFGFLMAYAMRQCSKLLIKATGLNSNLVRLVCLFLCFALFFILSFFIARSIFTQFFDLLKAAPKFYESFIIPFVNRLSDTLNSNYLSRYFEKNIISFLNEMSIKIASLTTNVALRLPELFITFIVTVISSFFICIDYEKIINSFCSIIPSSIYTKIIKIKSTIIITVFKILKCYFFIFAITYIELFLGLWLLNVEYSAVVALLIAAVDILPFIGTGLVLIPWSVISLVSGNIPFAIGIFSLYLIITVVRNIIEPKIIGKNIGIHPLIALFAMYIGLKLGGALLAVILLILVFVVKIQSNDNLNNKSTCNYIK